MQNKILILHFLIITISCSAQNIYPLNNFSTQILSDSYIKDNDNELDTFGGNYYAEYDGTKIYLFINKEIKKQMSSVDGSYYYKDLIWIKYKVTNFTGKVLQTTENSSDIKNKGIYDKYFDRNKNELYMYYSGTNCGVGWGRIQIKKISPTQISWTYYPNSSVLDDATCPPKTDLKIYLPETKDLVFTKQ